MSILKKAHEIVFERSEEKERQYGPFIECNERIAQIARILCQKNITTKDIYLIQVAIKLGRETFNHKQDNLLDAVAYLGALDDYYEQKAKKQKDKSHSVAFNYGLDSHGDIFAKGILSPEYLRWLEEEHKRTQKGDEGI